MDGNNNDSESTRRIAGAIKKRSGKQRFNKKRTHSSDPLGVGEGTCRPERSVGEVRRLREQTTIRLPAELMEQLKQEAEEKAG